MRMLITGFEPFGGRDINPSQMLLDDIKAPRGADIARLLLPVEFIKSGETLRRAAAEIRPSVILSFGQAGNVPRISIERVAVNLDNSRPSDGGTPFPDNSGDAPVDRKIIEGGPAAYFSALPVWDMVRAVNETGVPCGASYSAGTYVCNHVMYTACDIAAHTEGLKSGFIHVPFLPSQLGGEMQKGGRHAMEYEKMLLAVQAAVELLCR